MEEAKKTTVVPVGDEPTQAQGNWGQASNLPPTKE